MTWRIKSTTSFLNNQIFCCFFSLTHFFLKSTFSNTFFYNQIKITTIASKINGRLRLGNKNNHVYFVCRSTCTIFDSKNKQTYEKNLFNDVYCRYFELVGIFAG